MTDPKAKDMTNGELADALKSFAANALSDEAAARLRAMEWQPIDDGNVNPYVAYLTKHKDDLFPIVAALLPSVNGEPDYWARQIEGPEDDNHSPGWNGPLYRAPTHYITLDVLPIPPKT